MVDGPAGYMLHQAYLEGDPWLTVGLAQPPRCVPASCIGIISQVVDGPAGYMLQQAYLEGDPAGYILVIAGCRVGPTSRGIGPAT